MNTQAVNGNQVITKAYEDQFHQENDRSRRDVGLDFYEEWNDLVKNNQDKDLNDSKLTNLDSNTINRYLVPDNEVSNKKYIDNELDKITLVRFNQALENYLKVSIRNDTYKLTEYDKIQIIDITEIKSPNTGANLLQSRIFDVMTGRIMVIYIILLEKQEPFLQRGFLEQPAYLL